MTDQDKINEHSPTPWKRDGDGYGVFTAADEYVADFFLRADEDFALLAVNSHEELLAERDGLTAMLSKCLIVREELVNVCRHALVDLEGLALRDEPYLSNGIAETICKLQSAIAKAEGGTK